MKPVFIFLGVILGLISFFAPGSLFIFFIFAVSLIVLGRFYDKEESKFVLLLFSAAFILRAVFVFLIAFFSIVAGHITNYALSADCPDYSAPYLFADSGYYTLRALFTKMYWLGEPLSINTIKEYVTINYGSSGFVNILAIFYALFGYSPISSNLINSLFGALTAVVVYDMVKNIFCIKAARLSAILAAFFPSLFLWSTSNLKETSTIFFTSIILWSVVKYKINKKLNYLFISILAVFARIFIRPNQGIELSIVTVCLILIYAFYPYFMAWFRKKRVISWFILAVIILGVTHFLFRQRVIPKAIEKIYTIHRGVVNTGGICYKLLPDEFYTTVQEVRTADFLRMVAKGWFHIIFEPFPDRILTSKSIFFSLPQIILWYFLIPFGLIGMGMGLRYRYKESIFLIVYFLLMTSIMAPSGGNVGTIFRLRDEVITITFLIFSSAGLLKIFGSNFSLPFEKK